MSRSELVRLSGVSKQQLSRLEGGQIRMRLDHLKPFAKHLGFTPEQILLWGRYPGTGEGESGDPREEPQRRVPELDTRGDPGSGQAKREVRKDGRHADPIKPEGWVFPASFVREQLHASPERLLVIETNGDSMAPTVVSGDRVIVDTGHKNSYARWTLRHSRRVCGHRYQTTAGDALRKTGTREDHFRQYQARQRRGSAERA